MKFKTLGDPHLGRQFVHGVPLARRGEREQMLRDQFAKEYDSLDADLELHINMGDLFDKAVVSYDTILFAASVVNGVAAKYPKTTFVILKGNHDLFRDLERKSAFDVFAGLVHAPNVVIVTKPHVIGPFAFFGYDPINTAAEYVEATDLTGVHTVFGHWDENGFGSDHNVIPTKQLVAKGVKAAYSGHVHKKAQFNRDGVAVTIVGSMQPLAFGEQSDDSLYVEHTLASLKTAGCLKNKVVRVLLQKDELLEDGIDCLQLVTKRVGVEEETDAPVVTMGEFDMEALFKQAFTSAGVSEAVTTSLLGSYNDRRLATTD
jgi:DNA repair exonuclease SbcCD nuclease subunit